MKKEKKDLSEMQLKRDILALEVRKLELEIEIDKRKPVIVSKPFHDESGLISDEIMDALSDSLKRLSTPSVKTFPKKKGGIMLLKHPSSRL